jgi:hypothetical protein
MTNNAPHTEENKWSSENVEPCNLYSSPDFMLQRNEGHAERRIRVAVTLNLQAYKAVIKKPKTETRLSVDKNLS